MPDARISTLERRRAHLLGQLASIGEMRAGSLTARFRRCGTAAAAARSPATPATVPSCR